MTRASKQNRFHTGVAISATEICAADSRLRDAAGGDWRMPLDPPPSENGHWPSLASALADLARRLGANGGTISVSLLPPFTEARRLELPPLREDELQRVLARSAPRYFVNAKSPQVVGASLAAKRVRGAPMSVVAAAVPTRLLSAIRAAAGQSGFAIDVAAPAEGAWAATAIAMWPPFARQQSCVVVAHEDRTDLLQIEEGRLAGVRRFRAGATDAAMIAETIGSGVRAGVFGAPAQRRQLISSLAALGVNASPPAGEWSAIADSPERLAAQFASSPIGPVLRTEDAIAGDRARLRQSTVRVAIAATALLVVSAGIELWGVHRQLAKVRAERARIRPEIAATMVGRTTVDAAYRHLTTLAGIERSVPHWSSVIGTLTDAIPSDAFLLAVRTRDDSLVVDGLAERARRVFDALEKADGITGVRAAAPVRRELQDGGTTALEHFVIAGRVAQPESGLKALPVSNGAARRTGQ